MSTTWIGPLIFIAMTCTPLTAQVQFQRIGEPSAQLCAICIKLDTVVAFDLDPTFTISGTPHVATLANGAYIVSGGRVGHVYIHGAATTVRETPRRAVADTFPLSHVAALGNDFVAWAPSKRLLVAFDTLGAVTDTMSFPGSVYGLYAFSADTFIVQGTLPTPERFGFPLHLVSLRDRSVVSFGAGEDAVQFRQPYALRRGFLRGADGVSWISWRGAYRFRSLSASGMLSRDVQRDAPWFPSYVDYLPGEPFAVIPRPFFVGLPDRTGVSDGSLVAIIIVPDSAKWQPRDYFDSRDNDLSYDTILEVIDMNRGEVVARRRIDDAIVGILDHKTVFKVGYGSGGSAQVVVLSVNTQLLNQEPQS